MVGVVGQFGAALEVVPIDLAVAFEVAVVGVGIEVVAAVRIEVVAVRIEVVAVGIEVVAGIGPSVASEEIVAVGIEVVVGIGSSVISEEVVEVFGTLAVVGAMAEVCGGFDTLVVMVSREFVLAGRGSVVIRSFWIRGGIWGNCLLNGRERVEYRTVAFDIPEESG